MQFKNDKDNPYIPLVSILSRLMYMHNTIINHMCIFQNIITVVFQLLDLGVAQSMSYFR